MLAVAALAEGTGGDVWATCKECVKHVTDRQVRYACSTTAIGSRDCFLALDLKSCIQPSDCCGCGGTGRPDPPPLKASLRSPREVGVFLPLLAPSPGSREGSSPAAGSGAHGVAAPADDDAARPCSGRSAG
jgi:hypothetical protein